MKNTNNKRILLIPGLAIAALSYILIGASTGQVVGSTNNTSATVPAPTPTQKKVVLKNLGMA
jgi:hypothetical protein